MKILITGNAGFLGSHLADAFVEDGHEVIGIDNLIGGYKENVNSKVQFHQIDLCDYEKIKPLFLGVDVVYHCAATAYEGLSVFSPRLITKNIVDASISTISASIACGVKRFINLSSMARYGSNVPPFTEDMFPNPQDPYGIGKVAVENLLKNLADTHGMEWVIVVPHNIIGPRQKYDDPFRNVASIMINRILQKQPPIIYGDGEQMRCFSFVQDVIDPLKSLLKSKIKSEVINVGPDNEFVTINQLAKEILDLTGSELVPLYYPDRPKEVRYANCSAKKAKELLGYEAKTGLREGLTDLIEYIQDKGVKPFDYRLPLEIINDKTPITWKNQLF